MLDTPYHQVVVKAAASLAAASLAEVSALVAKAQAQHSKVLVQLKLIQANNKVAAKAKAKAEIHSTQVNNKVIQAKAAIHSTQVNKVVAKAKAKETHLIQVNNKVIQAKAAIHSIQVNNKETQDNNKEIQANNKVANNKQSRLHPYPYH